MEVVAFTRFKIVVTSLSVSPRELPFLRWEDRRLGGPPLYCELRIYEVDVLELLWLSCRKRYHSHRYTPDIWI